VARRLARVTDVGFITVAGGKHAMLSHGRVFERAAADFVVATQLGTAVGPPVERVLEGEDWVTA
jgi:hypothetical protein